MSEVDKDRKIEELEEETRMLKAQVSVLEGVILKMQNQQQTAMPSVADGLRLLTYKQHAVLALVVAGHTYSQTAKLSGLSDSTIKIMMRGVYQKLGVRGATEFASVCKERIKELIDSGVQERMCGLKPDFGRNPRAYPGVLDTLSERKHV